MDTLALTKTRIQAGVYEGVLTQPGKANGTPQLDMRHLDKPVGQIRLIAHKGDPNAWSVKASIPSSILTDGVQAFLIVNSATGTTLDQFTIVTGQPLEDDIRAEIALLRAELDMLKIAFRRHCVESGE